MIRTKGEQRTRARTKNYKGKIHQRQQGGEEKKTPRKDANDELYQKKNNPIQTLKTSGNAEIGLITAKDDNCCHPGDGEKIYFLLLLEERHKHRSSQSHAERQYKTLIKSDSDSHIN